MTSSLFEIEGFPFYLMDRDGNIYSKARQFLDKSGKVQTVKFAKRKLSKHGTGYLTIILTKNTGEAVTLRHHILVAKTFIPNPNNYPVVNHKNGNKHDNSIGNLEWCTHKQNHDHAIATDLKSSGVGVLNPACRFDKADVATWCILLKEGLKLKEIANMYNCNYHSISRLVNIEFPNFLGKYNGNYKNRKASV